MEPVQQDHLSNMELQVDHEVRKYLNDNSRWTKFISITIFIACGLLLLFAILGSSAIMAAFEKLYPGQDVFGEFSGALILGLIIFVVILLGFVYYFLFNFSQKIKAGMLNEDTNAFNQGLRSLKTYFLITAILSILALINSVYSLLSI